MIIELKYRVKKTRTSIADYYSPEVFLKGIGWMPLSQIDIFFRYPLPTLEAAEYRVSQFDKDCAAVLRSYLENSETAEYHYL